MFETKQKILDTAEALIAEQGYAATSLRQVIVTAEVNVAAVHYHFGSKEDLLDAVIARKAGPLNEIRLAQLTSLESRANGASNVEEILSAFLMPAAAMVQTNPGFVRFIGRMLNEGMMPDIVEKHFKSTGHRFLTALSRALPTLSQDEIMLRFQFMIGAMAHTMCAPALPNFADPNLDVTARMRRLVPFLGAAFRTPAENL